QLLEDPQDALGLVELLVDVVQPQDDFAGAHARKASPGSVLMTCRIESNELSAEQSAVVPRPASTRFWVITTEIVVFASRLSAPWTAPPPRAQPTTNTITPWKTRISTPSMPEAPSAFMQANTGSLSTVEI